MKTLLKLFSTVFLFSVIIVAPQAHALKKLTAKIVQDAGMSTAACPKFIGNIDSGLSSSILNNTSICVTRGRFGKLAKDVVPTPFVLNGGYSMGVPFTSVVNQQGDVQTTPFEVMNYPAIITYSIQNSNFESSFKITVIDTNTGAIVRTIFRSRGSVNGEFAFNTPGQYYLKMQAYGDAHTSIQPIYSVSMRFMNPYVGLPITKGFIQATGVKTAKCPKKIIDTSTNRVYTVSKRFMCFKEDPIRATFVSAPLNLGATLFLATTVNSNQYGETASLPFRVLGPSPLKYSVSDPSGGKGGYHLFLAPVAGGNSRELVNVKGTIVNTTTSINLPGDYYVRIETEESDPKKYGDIGSNFSVTGSH